MIIIAPEKKICKRKIANKIGRKTDVKFFDGTEHGNSSKANKFANVSTMDIFNPLRGALKTSSVLDGDDIKSKKIIERHLDDNHVRRDIKVIGTYQIEHDNDSVILILKNKVYNLWVKKYIKTFKNVLGISEGVYSLDDILDNGKLISKEFSSVLTKKEYKAVCKTCGIKKKSKKVSKLKLPW